MKEKMQPILFYTLLVAAAVLIFFPFLYLTQYNHPSADDFCFARLVNYLGYLPAQINYYLAWSGRYMATALLTLMPIDHQHLLWYRLLPIVLLVLFFISIYLFIYKFAPGASKKDRSLLSLLIIFLYLFQAPNVTEAFYWMAGSITYQLPIILTLFLFATIIHLNRTQKKQEVILFTILGGLLCIAIIGSNEISMIVHFIVITLWTAIRFLSFKRFEKRMIILLVISILFTGIAVFAPGNFMRMSSIDHPGKYQLYFSISGSVQSAFAAIVKWTPIIVLSILIFYGSLGRIATKIYYKHKPVNISLWHIFFLGILLFGITALCYFPSYWSQAGRPPTRTINVIYFNFILGCMAIALITFFYLRQQKELKTELSLRFRSIIGIGIMAILILQSNNIRTAYGDIIKGTAISYDLDMIERYKLLNKCVKDICDIPPLKNKPSTIFAYDIAHTPQEQIYYYNICLVDYLHGTITGNPDEDSKE